jgi:hypothetical protein
MKIFKTTLLLVVFFMPFHLFAAEFSCNQSGNWNNPVIWDVYSGSDADGIPDADDNVDFIQKTVTLTSDVVCKSLDMYTSTIDAANHNIEIKNFLSMRTWIDKQPSYIINAKDLKFEFGELNYASISSLYPGGGTISGKITFTLDDFSSSGFPLPYPTNLSIKNCTIEGDVSGNKLFLGENAVLRLVESNVFSASVNEIYTDNAVPVGVPYGSFGKIEILNNYVIKNVNGIENWKCPVVINGTVTVPNGKILGLSTTPEYPITGTGKIILQQGGLLNSSVGLAPLELKGPSLENYTVLTSLPIIFNGTTPQTLSGPGTMNNVTVDNPNGLTIDGNPTINELTLTNGGLVLNDADVTVNNFSGDSPTRYVVTNGTGKLYKRIIPRMFNILPVGTSTSYSPVRLRIPNSVTPYKYGASVKNGINPSRPLSGVAGTNFINKEWNISREASAPSANVYVELSYRRSDTNSVVFNCANMSILHHNGTSWDVLPDENTVRDCNEQYIAVSNVTDFSPFAIGVANAVLSTDLISIKATPLMQAQYQAVLVNWQTANEQNMLDFGVERSVDGSNFEKIGTVKATNAPNIYSYKDAAAQTNTLYYYRLAMRENNGKTEYSKVVTATLSGKTKTVSVFPNPAKDVLTIAGIEPTDEWQVVDIIGKIRATYKGSQTLDLTGFSNGIYFIKMGNENRSRFVVSK